MGVVRALDAGTLTLTRFVRLIEGANLDSLTAPLSKAAALAKMEDELAAKTPRGRRK